MAGEVSCERLEEGDRGDENGEGDDDDDDDEAAEEADGKLLDRDALKSRALKIVSKGHGKGLRRKKRGERGD